MIPLAILLGCQLMVISGRPASREMGRQWRPFCMVAVIISCNWGGTLFPGITVTLALICGAAITIVIIAAIVIIGYDRELVTLSTVGDEAADKSPTTIKKLQKTTDNEQ